MSIAVGSKKHTEFAATANHLSGRIHAIKVSIYFEGSPMLNRC
jgi:hypothetical protein